MTNSDDSVKTMFQQRGNNYCPKIDEPSPFHPHELLNPWAEWHKTQPEYNSHIDVGLTQSCLCEALEEERLTRDEADAMEKPPLTIPTGEYLSLAWVMYYAALTDFAMHRCHRIGLEMMKKRVLPYNGELFQRHVVTQEGERYIEVTGGFFWRSRSDSSKSRLLLVTLKFDKNPVDNRLSLNNRLSVSLENGTDVLGLYLTLPETSWSTTVIPEVTVTILKLDILEEADIQDVMPHVVEIIHKAIPRFTPDDWEENIFFTRPK